MQTRRVFVLQLGGRRFESWQASRATGWQSGGCLQWRKILSPLQLYLGATVLFSDIRGMATLKGRIRAMKILRKTPRREVSLH